MINNPPTPSPWRCVKETEPSTASVWGHLQHSWLLCDLLQHSPLPVPPLLPPGTCRGSTLGCCLLCGRRSALCVLERHRGLFRGCLSRFSPHLDRRARREPTNVYEAAQAPLSRMITPFSLVEITAVRLKFGSPLTMSWNSSLRRNDPDCIGVDVHSWSALMAKTDLQLLPHKDVILLPHTDL